MAKKTNQEIADEFFAKHKNVEKVLVSSDGYAFVTENSANLHKDTSGKKGITISTFLRNEKGAEPKTPEAPKKVKLDKLKKAELVKVAESKGIRPDENATNAEIIKAIEAVDNAKINE